MPDIFILGFIAGVIVGTILFYLVNWYSDPFKTKPIPSISEIRRRLNAVARLKSTKTYKTHFHCHWSNAYCPLEKVDTVPKIIQGNTYNAILTLDRHFDRRGVDFLDYLRRLAAVTWNPKTDFISHMKYYIKNNSYNCFYLTKNVKL